jgi:SMI1 / KNR4 family (SUKH-1)
MTLPDILSQLSLPHPDREVTFHPPATRSQIRDFEAILKAPLPDDLQEFYLSCNGFDTRDFLFRVLPLEDIVRDGIRGRDCFAFAEYMIYSETWLIRLDPADTNFYWISNEYFANPLTRSLAVFLDRYRAGGLFGPDGLSYWSEESK